MAKNVGRECEESSVPFPALAGALGLCLSFSMQKLCSAFHSEQGSESGSCTGPASTPCTGAVGFPACSLCFIPNCRVCVFTQPDAAPIPVQSMQEALGVGEGLLWGLTLSSGAVAGAGVGSELHLQPNLPQAVTGAV